MFSARWRYKMALIIMNQLKAIGGVTSTFGDNFAIDGKYSFCQVRLQL